MNAMAQLANGLSETQQHEAALSVREAELSTLRRLGQAEEQINNSKANLAFSYECLGRHEEALVLRRELYAWSSFAMSGTWHMSASWFGMPHSSVFRKLPQAFLAVKKAGPTHAPPPASTSPWIYSS